jgi:hypothetical protein
VTELNRKDKMGAGCLSLFALPFAGVGVAAFCYLGFMLWTWHRMASWVPVPAEIASLELERHRGDDAVTHKVVAHYRYRFDGREYVGDRAAISSISDNLGDFQQQLYRELETARARRMAVAYVDPANPADATLNRDLRWTLAGFAALFGLVFGGVGFGLLFGARFSARKLAAQRALERRFPKEPWRWREEWKGGRIAASNRADAYGVTIFAVLWNLISFPAALFVPDATADGNWLALVALLFPAVGIGLAAWAIRSWLRVRRFELPTLVLDRLPIPLGGKLEGTVKVDMLVPVAREFKLRLNCVARRRSRNNKGANERLLWQNEWTVPKHSCQLASTYSTIPVDVAVPDDLPPASTAQEDERIVWRLEITGKCPGPDFASTFEVPVFAVGVDRKTRVDSEAPGPARPVPAPGDRLDSSQAKESARQAARTTARETAPAPDPRRLESLGILYERLPQGREAWTFRRANHKGLALGLTALTLIWTGICVALRFADAPLIFPIVFGLFDVLFVWWTLHLWFAEYRVTLDEHNLTIVARGFGGTRTFKIPRRQITRVRARRGMQAGNKLYYDLKVETGNRQSRTAATSVGDYSVAEWLAEHWMSDERMPGRTAS